MNNYLLGLSCVFMLLMAGCGSQKTDVKNEHSASSTQQTKSAKSSSSHSKEKESSTSKSTKKESSSTQISSQMQMNETSSVQNLPTGETTTSSYSNNQINNYSNIQDQKCPDASEMTPEAKAEMERYYDGNNDGIPDSQQSSAELEENDNYDEYGNEIEASSDEGYENYTGDPEIQADTQRKQIEWAQQHGLID